MGNNNWLLLLAGVLLGGGGFGGLLSAFFARSRDRTAAKATEVQVGLDVLREAIATLKAENAQLRADLTAERKKRR